MSETTHRIQVAVHSVDQLLDVAGSPLVAPRIHPDVACSIRTEAGEHRRGSRFTIEINVPTSDLGREAEVATAVRAQFRREAVEARDELKSLRDKGRWSFLIALIVVGLLTVLGEFVGKLGDARIFEIISESLVIVAWVTLWSPAETIIFARFPVRRALNLANALAEADVRLATKM